jgi:hypothetical protein
MENLGSAVQKRGFPRAIPARNSNVFTIEQALASCSRSIRKTQRTESHQNVRSSTIIAPGVWPETSGNRPATEGNGTGQHQPPKPVTHQPQQHRRSSPDLSFARNLGCVANSEAFAAHGQQGERRKGFHDCRCELLFKFRIDFEKLGHTDDTDRIISAQPQQMVITGHDIVRSR